jgi:hypothetical protein
MGWNRVWHGNALRLFEGIEDGARFYFVHSYFHTTPHAPDAESPEVPDAGSLDAPDAERGGVGIRT